MSGIPNLHPSGMGLDERGKLAIATIVFYVPIFFAALYFTVKYGIKREAGWVFLFTFSIIRILGGAVHVAYESLANPTVQTLITALALESAGVAPLVMCTAGFLALIAERDLREHVLGSRYITYVLRLAIGAAFSVSIAGAAKVTSVTAAGRSRAATLRRAGAALFIAVFVVILGLHLAYWALYRRKIANNHKKLLASISLTLPFLTVRLVYACLSVFGPPIVFGPAGPVSPHSEIVKFNLLTGEWWIFLVMGLVMEYAIALIYLAVGFVVPLGVKEVDAKEKEKEKEGSASPSRKWEELEDARVEP